MEPLKENQSAGYYRLQIYEAIANTLKRELTENEHKHLSTILKLYGNSHVVVNKTFVHQKPLVHEYTCVNCKATKVADGPKEHKSLRSAIKKEKIANPLE